MAKKHYSTPARGGASVKVTAIIAVLLAVVCAAYVVLSLVFKSWNPVKWTETQQNQADKDGENNEDKDHDNDNKDKPNDGSNLDVSFEDDKTDGVSLLCAKLPRTAYAANGIAAQAEVAYTITATLIPSSVENKLVDWSIVNADDGSSVSEYATLVPTSDGSLTANLTILQAFPDITLKIICTSRDSGASGSKFVRCEGIATGIMIGGSVANITGCRWGNTNRYLINLSNDIDYVGNSQYANLTVTNVTVYGTVTRYSVYFVANAHSTSEVLSGSASYTEGEQTVQLSSYKPNAVTASISGQYLVIMMSSYPSATYSSAKTFCTRAGVLGSEVYDYYTAPQNAYAEITVKTGNLQKTFRVDFEVGVEGIDLGNDIVV